MLLMYLVVVGCMEKNDVRILVNSDHNFNDYLGLDIHVSVRRNSRTLEEISWGR